MNEPPQDRMFVQLMDKISRECGFRCASYKDRCLRRRIAVRMRARAVHRYEDYGRVLDSDDGEYELLMDALTINVTKLFRNPATFDAVARHVVPTLWSNAQGRINVWSAGTASGEEAYSLAILFHRHAMREAGHEGLLRRVAVLGTDIDRKSMAAAQRGVYAEGAFADTPAELRETYFSHAEPFSVHEGIRSLVRFARHDLIREAPPGTGFSLIACRNVIIYFDQPTQESLFQRFYDSLSPGGFLVLGKVETLFGHARDRFVAVDARERIFRKL